MSSGALQIVGLVLGGIGLVLTCLITGLPTWKVTAFIENNIIVFETQWEGLWMSCVRQINIRMQCKIYDSLLALPSDLQAGRALMCVAVALSATAIAIAILGMRCTRFNTDNEKTKGLILLVAGLVFILSGIAVLIPVSWTGHSIIRDFYNPLVPPSVKRELGDALFIGWTTSVILIAGGVILCLSCHTREEGYQYKLPPRSPPYSAQKGIQRTTSSRYSKSQYV
ncbi:claudin-8-like [Ambystoma mexicanum]|uniref:claudin-8-like n=1 Tax=Ambystoma mexicanum TaxID=8296 RepID=UPI0037E761ED